MADDTRIIDKQLGPYSASVTIKQEGFPGARSWLFAAWVAFLAFTLGSSYRADTHTRVMAVERMAEQVQKMQSAADNFRRTVCSATPESEMHQELRDTCFPPEYN